VGGNFTSKCRIAAPSLIVTDYHNRAFMWIFKLGRNRRIVRARGWEEHGGDTSAAAGRGAEGCTACARAGLICAQYPARSRVIQTSWGGKKIKRRSRAAIISCTPSSSGSRGAKEASEAAVSTRGLSSAVPKRSKERECLGQALAESEGDEG
jgi:hypothetical protein